MKVFKFGGASASTIDRIKNIAAIIKSSADEKLLIVISAIGKTTNALEKVAQAFYEGRNEDALRLFELIKGKHLDILKYLLTINWKPATEELKNYFTEVEWLLHEKAVRDYNYYYDQIVCIGELLSTTIISWYLREENVFNTLVDVRDIFRTDDNFRNAEVDITFTKDNIVTHLIPLFSNSNIVITQGFIGATDENESTTLGREGSDFSAALFANLLDAESLTIWKDVEGIMNADPKEFDDATYLPLLSYTEVIEMAYYGAQVIHPKTIKPLENKNIPLFVKCFLKPELPGTIITNAPVHHLPPIKILKHHQVLLTLSSTDFSFVGEEPISRLYEIFSELKIRPNLIQSTAISLLCCMDDVPEKIEQLALLASEVFDVRLQKQLTLLTIRHYTTEILERLISGKNIVLEQKTKDTIQVLSI